MTMDITETTAPRSDQQNFDDYAAGITRTVTITEVKAGSDEQPVEVHLAEYPGRPYKPSKTMRRVLVAAWGPETSVYVGRRMRLHGDPSVKFGGIVVGGIKIGALSHIDKAMSLSLTSTRGKREPHTVEPLPDAPPPDAPPPDAPPPGKPLPEQVVGMLAAFVGFGVTEDQLVEKVGRPSGKWTVNDLAALRVIGASLRQGTVTVAEEFPSDQPSDNVLHYENDAE